MQKTILPLIFSVAVLLSLVQPAKALTIHIDENGQMSFLSGQVLGKDSEDDSKDEPEHEDEQEDEKEDEKEPEHTESEREKPRETVRETPKPEEKRTEKKPELKQVLKNISAKENKLLKIKNNREKTEVSVEAKTKPTPGKRQEKRGSDDLPEQEVETESVDIKLPANEKPELRVRPENEKKAINAEIERIKKERSERRDSLELKSKTKDDGSNEFEIESGSIKAKLKSAEFAVDPATNEVKITTANGETHTLIHLPDQALQQMIATKELKDADEIDQSELTLETKEDGSVVYKTKVTNKRRILGFIPFNYESEVELNDADSEITSEPTDKSFIGQLLFRLSR